MTMTSSDTEKAADVGDFKLQSQSSSFTSKADAVFGSLATLEKKHEAYEKVRSKNDDEAVFVKPDPVMDRLIDDRERRGRGGRFNRGRPRHSPYVPMYRREPKKWTMYDLSDVDPASMSEKSTKAAALSFLSDLKKRKKSESTDSVVDSSDSKIVFKKPFKPKNDDSIVRSSCSTSGKHIMPEYNFGVKKKTEKVKKSGNVASGSEIRLTHLDDEVEDG